MRVLLLDTCIVSALLDPAKRSHPTVQQFIDTLDPQSDHTYVCPIAIAEIKFGYEVCLKHDEARKSELLRKLRRYPVVDIDKHTTDHYARVRGALFNKFGTRDAKRKIREKLPEELIELSTAKSLGIQENDLWLVACALQYNMTFVTSDKMSNLKEIVLDDLKLPLDWVSWKN